MCSNFRIKRNAAGLSQKQMASLLGVSQEAVSRWERGNAKPRAEKFTAIANALGCPVCDVLSLFFFDTERGC